MNSPDKNTPEPARPAADPNAWATSSEETIASRGSSADPHGVNDPADASSVAAEDYSTAEHATEDQSIAGAPVTVKGSRGQRLRAGTTRAARSRWTQLVAALLVGVIIGGGVVGLVGRGDGGRRGVESVQSDGLVGDQPGQGRQREGNRDGGQGGGGQGGGGRGDGQSGRERGGQDGSQGGGLGGGTDQDGQNPAPVPSGQVPSTTIGPSAPTSSAPSTGTSAPTTATSGPTTTTSATN